MSNPVVWLFLFQTTVLRLVHDAQAIFYIPFILVNCCYFDAQSCQRLLLTIVSIIIIILQGVKAIHTTHGGRYDRSFPTCSLTGTGLISS
jgi:hypothetical protein